MQKPTPAKSVLFLSADLVGSTEYKVRTPDRDGRPGWLDTYSRFFREFPLVLIGQIAVSFAEEETVPEADLWKVAGDEILFSCELRGPEECRLLIRAFCESVSKYDRQLVKAGLRLRGCAWGAAFPHRNTELEIPEMGGGRGEGSVYRDYLGPDVDTGFRLSPHADPGEVVISLNAAEALLSFDHPTNALALKGRQPLKGLFAGIPYPILVWSATNPPESGVSHGQLSEITRGFETAIGSSPMNRGPARLF